MSATDDAPAFDPRQIAHVTFGPVAPDAGTQPPDVTGGIYVPVPGPRGPAAVETDPGDLTALYILERS